jgi:hypothetical protein
VRAASGLNLNTRHTTTIPIYRGLQYGTALQQSNVRKLQQPASHAALQHRAADCESKQFAGRVAQIEAVVEPKNLIDKVAGGCALSEQFFGEARKQLLEHLASPSQQSVRMSSLGNTFSGLVTLGKRIAFNYDHFAIVTGQGTSR